MSKIKVETYFRNGVNLFSDERTASVQVFSNSPFSVYVENLNEEDKGYELIKYRVNKTSDDSTEYHLSVAIPQEITHNFKSNIVLVHPVTSAKTIIPINFDTRSSRGILSRAS